MCQRDCAAGKSTHLWQNYKPVPGRGQVGEPPVVDLPEVGLLEAGKNPLRFPISSEVGT